MKCENCSREILNIFEYCPFCGKKQEHKEIEGEVTRTLVVDGRGFRYAAFVSYLGLPVGIIISIICACLNVWLIKRSDILGAVNIIEYLAAAGLGYVATKGLKSFKRYSFVSLIVMCGLVVVSNVFRFIHTIGGESPYDLRNWSYLAVIKIVCALLTAVYFLKRSKSYSR